MIIKTAQLLFLAVLSSLAVPAESQFGFVNFPFNLTLTITQNFDINWQGQDSYVNISLARFYYFGGSSETVGLITSMWMLCTHRCNPKAYKVAFNNGGGLTWTPDRSLEQGIYAFFIGSPNRNSSESPFFALTTASVPAAGGLSDVAKVGLGVGVPLGFITLACSVFIFWREKTWRAGDRQRVPSAGQRVVELESKGPIYELRAET